ncbi:MAG: pyridoxal-phosphate dependent enzyme [Defluviicoccus sp.]|nr:pyridoxal-phosphate dependent enzyme [Defluviicoccus sp.]MDE0384550.1 pyridoxal-phosphate dependent enzyme [Defluviicoccus sp.]
MKPTSLACIGCGETHPLDAFARACRACAEAGVTANLGVVYGDAATPRRDAIPAGPATLWRFADALPLAAEDAVSLGEGMTPLVPIAAPHRGSLWVKDETRNPSWSFKDRLASVAVSWAKKIGAQVIATSSSGNAGAAAASYAARANLPCVVLTFRGAAGPMVGQIRAAGAMVLECAEKEDRWRILSRAVKEFGWFPTSPFFGPAAGSNPIGIEGYKTLAYEIAEGLGWRAPDWCVLPVCYGDALFGLWKGFDEMRRWGWTEAMPRLVAAEVSGSLAAGLAGEDPMPPAVARDGDSIAVSIDIPRSTAQALLALRRTDGIAVALDDAEIATARAALARREGLFVEASSAAAFAAIERLGAAGTFRGGDSVVAIATASGLKDAGSSPADALPGAGTDLDGLRCALKQSYGFDV